MTAAREPMARFFTPGGGEMRTANRAPKYLPAINPENAPWSQILDRAVKEFALDRYPEDALSNALENFEEANGRAADPADPADFEEAQERTFTLLGWDR